jgi:hypothetical protein
VVELGLAVVWPWEMLLFSAAVPAYIMFDCLFILELHFAIFFYQVLIIVCGIC